MNSLASISIKAILSSEKALSQIGWLPKTLQIDILTAAVLSSKSVLIAGVLKECSLSEVSDDILARKAQGNVNGYLNIDSLSSVLMSAYLLAIRDSDYPKKMHKLCRNEIQLNDLLQSLNEARDSLESRAVTERFEISTDLLKIDCGDSLGISPAAGLVRFLNRNGSARLHVTYRRVMIHSDDYPEFIRKVLIYIDPTIEGLALRCTYSLKPCLPELKQFGQLKELAIESTTEGNSERHLAAVISRMKMLEVLRIMNAINYYDGPVIKLLLERTKKPLKVLEYSGEKLLDEDLVWLGESKHKDTLTCLDFSLVSLNSLHAIKSVFSKFKSLEVLCLRHCSLTKVQVIEIAASLKNCSHLRSVFMEQYTGEARQYTLADSLEIFGHLLCIESKYLKEVTIDIDNPEVIISDCQKLIRDAGFTNIFCELKLNGILFTLPWADGS